MKNINVKIIYEDNHVLVVEKPINIPTQQDKTEDLDFLTILKQDLKQRYDKPGNVYLGLVHRLDRPVGGVMVFAKTSKAASRLSDQIRKGEIQKVYLTVIHGVPEKLKGTLQHYLIKDKSKNIVKFVSQFVKNAKLAKLDYKVLQHLENLSLVKVNLHTGRSHQIRVQFSSIGHFIYGDKKYGKQDKKEKQIALWSYRISFKHPVTKKYLKFESHPPNVFPWNIFNVNE